MERKSNLLKIISNYKVKNQLKKLHEEIYELTETVLEYEHSTRDNIEYVKLHMTEEFADCMVLLMQIKLFYGISDVEVNDVMDYKIQRQLDRMQKEFIERKQLNG